MQLHKILHKGFPCLHCLLKHQDMGRYHDARGNDVAVESLRQRAHSSQEKDKSDVADKQPQGD